jgi:hypothetical protein
MNSSVIPSAPPPSSSLVYSSCSSAVLSSPHRSSSIPSVSVKFCSPNATRAAEILSESVLPSSDPGTSPVKQNDAASLEAFFQSLSGSSEVEEAECPNFLASSGAISSGSDSPSLHSLTDHSSANGESDQQLIQGDSSCSLTKGENEKQENASLKLGGRFVCSECKKQFPSNSALSMHKLVHSGEKPHGCPHPGCGRRFRQKGHLVSHFRKHIGLKPYECKFQTCGKKFKDKSGLNTHVKRAHAGEKPPDGLENNGRRKKNKVDEEALERMALENAKRENRKRERNQENSQSETESESASESDSSQANWRQSNKREKKRSKMRRIESESGASSESESDSDLESNSDSESLSESQSQMNSESDSNSQSESESPVKTKQQTEGNRSISKQSHLIDSVPILSRSFSAATPPLLSSVTTSTSVSAASVASEPILSMNASGIIAPGALKRDRSKRLPVLANPPAHSPVDVSGVHSIQLQYRLNFTPLHSHASTSLSSMSSHDSLDSSRFLSSITVGQPTKRFNFMSQLLGSGNSNLNTNPPSPLLSTHIPALSPTSPASFLTKIPGTVSANSSTSLTLPLPQSIQQTATNLSPSSNSTPMPALALPSPSSISLIPSISPLGGLGRLLKSQS